MTTSLKTRQTPSRQQDPADLEKVMVELFNLRKQSERLDLINRLHNRMAGVLSLGGMIEAYSVWLMPLVAHELIGYNNSQRNKRHLFCSGHGPYRRKAIALAERLIDEKMPPTQPVSEEDGRFAYKWIFETSDDSGILLILKQGYELRDEEMDLVNHSLEILAESLRRGLEYEQLFERASCDVLTGLNNRRVFEDRIHGMMDSARRYHNPLTMVSMDLDHFKQINDNLGHQKGDEVLKVVAGVLKGAVRSTDLLVRMGGDEFVLVLDNTDLPNGRVLAKRLCQALSDLDIIAGEQNKLGISVGMSELRVGETLKQWLERTDDILYHAKAEGRARVAVESGTCRFLQVS